jgi:phage/plasmid-like protein (TIGR03299 family)
MSRETSEWLNQYVLIGYAAERGTAWHYRPESQGDEPNHYDGPVPYEDVVRRLFDWTAESREIYTLTDRGYVAIPDRQAIVTSDTEDVLGVFKSGYTPHQYQEWLLENVSLLLDNGDIGIGSAMLLRGRAQACVSIEVPESVTTPEGVEFRPNLLACTSFDGSLATTYKRVVQEVVCDNTMDLGLSEAGQEFKIKHSKYSRLQLQGAKDALAIVHMMGADFAEQIKSLCAWKVTDAQWKSVLDNLVPVPDDEGRGKTMAENKRAELIAMYHSDEMVAPWAGTAYGVIQAFNTWNHHKAIVRKGTPRFIRNMENVVTGKMAGKDNEVLAVLNAVAV